MSNDGRHHIHFVFGTSGDDEIHLKLGVNSVHTGRGNDIVGDGLITDFKHGRSDDFIFTGAGDDVIGSQNGNDVIVAGSGDDTVQLYGYDDLIVSGGSGDDSVHLHEKGSVPVFHHRGGELIALLGHQKIVMDGIEHVYGVDGTELWHA